MLIRKIFFVALLGCVSLSYADTQKLQAPLFDNLGSFHHEISTKVPLAQRFFDQGFVLFYGFEWGESIRSFKEAIRLDPNCGMCYWGLALALAEKMNAPMNGREYSDGQTAVRKALSLKAYETPMEQDYIKALSLRFQHAPKVIKKEGAFNCHKSSGNHDVSTPSEMLAYSNAMKKITEKYADDNDAKALYAYALFNRINWATWDLNGKINPLTPEIVNTLKSILAKEELHIGGNHYYIHVMEISPKPEDALASADRLKTLVPGSEHLVHMPSHIYMIIGRYHDGSVSNQQAIDVFDEYIKFCYANGFNPEINYLYFHNYDFLRTTATLEGRKELALWAANKIVTKPFPLWLSHEPSLQWFIPIPWYVQIRFGMWDEILKQPKPDAKYQYALGMWHYAQGMALVNSGNVKAAQEELLALNKIISNGPTLSNLEKSGLSLLKIAGNVLLAKTATTEKNTIIYLKAADKIQHDMGYHEPPDWYFPMKEMLANAYLKLGNTKEAVRMYEKVLKQYPNNPWALYGLAKALQKEKKDELAEQVESEFKESWKYADIPIPIEQ